MLGASPDRAYLSWQNIASPGSIDWFISQHLFTFVSVHAYVFLSLSSTIPLWLILASPLAAWATVTLLIVRIWCSTLSSPFVPFLLWSVRILGQLLFQPTCIQQHKGEDKLKAKLVEKRGGKLLTLVELRLYGPLWITSSNIRLA